MPLQNIAPYHIYIDTRERKPWRFDPAYYQTSTRTLVCYDYTMAGMEDVCGLERKRDVNELVSTVIGRWDRFKRQLVRMQELTAAIIVVESPYSELMHGHYHSKCPTMYVQQRLVEIHLEYGIPALFLGSRAGAQLYAERWLKAMVEIRERSSRAVCSCDPRTGWGGQQ